eukprot:6681072-Lingulodinium_polyedra.AAC.1
MAEGCGRARTANPRPWPTTCRPDQRAWSQGPARQRGRGGERGAQSGPSSALRPCPGGRTA